MDITVEVYAERVSTGERRHTHTAHAVFVAIDQHGRPRRVPRLVPDTDEERAAYERARAHRDAREAART
jgi:acyl-CoA hydrolase